MVAKSISRRKTKPWLKAVFVVGIYKGKHHSWVSDIMVGAKWIPSMHIRGIGTQDAQQRLVRKTTSLRLKKNALVGID